MLEPVEFHPLYMERVWGGRSMASLFGRRLPGVPGDPAGGPPIGESWEMVDREREQSVVRGGPLDGLSLHDLWRDRRIEVFGAAAERAGSDRFPLLLKILDARETLSIQVHPPARVAAALGGEPKTEMWFIAHAEPGACLFIGVKEGVDRAAFERALEAGTVADVVNRLPVRTGDSIFIPSGRLHAIGAGLVIFEIQQNSDTTYRVFDWNRMGLDGKPRALHIAESLACIDFSDTAPALNPAGAEVLADCPFFRVERRRVEAGGSITHEAACIVAVTAGRIEWSGRGWGPGDFFLLPEETARSGGLRAGSDCELLCVTLP
jgi:mannose-6-phosphate isomerase